MRYSIADVIRVAGAGTRDDLVTAAGQITSLTISLKVREISFPQQFRRMIEEIFVLQIRLRALLEDYELALSPRTRASKEGELRERIAELATAVQEFEHRAQKSISKQFQLVGAGPATESTLVDVGVLTVIPQELRAAQRALKASSDAKYVTRSGTIYWLLERQLGKSNQTISIILGCIAEAGNYDAASATSRMIAAANPKLMLRVGIAAGIRGKVKIGNVVLSERIVAYEYASLEALRQSKPREQARPEIEKPSHRMRQALAAYDPDEAEGRVYIFARKHAWEDRSG